MSNIVEEVYEKQIQDGLSRFGIWEKRKAVGDSITPSIYSDEYCRLVATKVMSLCGVENPRILSIGCGNGFLEEKIMQCGGKVLATDISDIALKFSKNKGLETEKLDASKTPWNYHDASFDIVLAEGCVGHLIKEGSIDYLVKEANRVLKQDGLFVIINDIPKEANVEIQRHADPTINFYWVSKNYLEESVERAMTSVNGEYIEYQRPISGKTKRAFVYGRKK